MARRKFLYCLLCLWLLLGGRALAETTVLKYKVRWLGFTAGKIQIAIRTQGAETYVMASSKTVGMVRLFFPFQSRWETWIGPDGYPIKSRIWRKRGKKEVTKEFLFEQERGVVKRIYKGQVRTDVVGRKVHDELSAFVYSFRLKWHSPGEKEIFWIYAHRKAHRAVLTYLKDEEVKTYCGWVKAQKIQADFGFQSELVKRARKALFWWWCGQLVQSEGDMPIGHLTAILCNPECKR